MLENNDISDINFNKFNQNNSYRLYGNQDDSYRGKLNENSNNISKINTFR